jgi:diacylglycerol kinase
LVEAERGLTAGFRSDSVFFVHLFGGCLVVAAAVLFGLTVTQWAVLILALSVTIAAELFHQVLKQLGDLLAETAPRPAAKVSRLATAAVAVSTFGTLLTAAVLLGSRLWALFTA